MLPFQTLIFIDKQLGTPVYRQIANRLVNLIREGVIRPGTVLPGSREMAELLQVHRKTIVAAYEELSAQDWITTIPRKGVFVAENLPDIKPRKLAAAGMAGYAGSTGFTFDKQVPASVYLGWQAKQRLIINDGTPDMRLAPMDILLREYKSIVKNPTVHMMLERTQPAGIHSLREALTDDLAATRGLNIHEGNVLITRGAQMAIYLAAQLLIKPGDHVVVGEPNYFMANLLFEQLGARLIKIPVDEQGMDVEALAAACRKKKIRMVYVVPHHHHPTTATLSAERRMRLLELVRQHKLAVIEDDYDFSFHYDSSPILPLASTQHDGCVIYIGSVTKMMTPSLRVGFMIAPENFIQQATYLKRLMDLRNDNLMEAALAAMIRNGDIGRHLKKSNKIYHQRRDLFCGLLDKHLRGIVQYNKPGGGMAIWAKFDRKHPLPEVAARAARLGVFMSDGSTYITGKTNHNALRMGFASLNEKEMESIISILKKVC
jgi:GntR family transcriptional regulator/MocR family aminotransferase